MVGLKRKMRLQNCTSYAKSCSQFQVNGQTFATDFEAALFIILKSNSLTLGKFLEQAIEEHKELEKHRWKLALLQDETFLNGRITKVEELLTEELDSAESARKKNRTNGDCGSSLEEDSEEGEAEFEREVPAQSPTPSRSENFSGSESHTNQLPRSSTSHMTSSNENQNSTPTTVGTMATVSSSPVTNNAVSPSPTFTHKPTGNRNNQNSSSGSSEQVNKSFQISSQTSSEVISISPRNSAESSPKDREHVPKGPKSESTSLPRPENNGGDSSSSQAAQVPSRKLVQVSSASLPIELLKQCEVLFSHVNQHMPQLENITSCAYCTVPPREILMDNRTLLMCYNKQCKLSSKPQLNRVVGWKYDRQDSTN